MFKTYPAVAVAVVGTLALVMASALDAGAQEEESGPPGLAALLARADSANPEVVAARWAVRAARAAVAPAGALPDPTLVLGIRNLPIVEPGLGNDFMTMAVVGVEETFPFPGKRGLREAVARAGAEASAAELVQVRRRVHARVASAYYALYELDRSLEIALRNQALLTGFARTAAARYAVGDDGQADVLRAQLERTRLQERIVDLRERRRSAEARLNALVARPSGASVPSPGIPAGLLGLVSGGAADGGAVSFASAGAADAAPMPGSPSVQELQRLAEEHSPMVRAHVRRIEGRHQAVALAEKATLPDFRLSLSYGQRSGFTDMVNAQLSIPLPVFAGRKQDQAVLEERALLAEDQAAHHAMIHRLNQQIATVAAELRRAHGQLRLYVDGILPQARTALEAARAEYRVGRASFLTLLDSQVTLFDHELAYHRLLVDLATGVTRLEEIVGLDIEEMER